MIEVVKLIYEIVQLVVLILAFWHARKGHLNSNSRLTELNTAMLDISKKLAVADATLAARKAVAARKREGQ